jgi:uncharacterized damage-inducible protein DinB
METVDIVFGRRNFLKKTALFSTGVAGITVLPQVGWAEPREEEEKPNVIGPRKGFTPHIGTMVSMMSWMRGPVLRTARGLTTEQLDYLHDEKSNSIGAMLLHLAATEKYYQLHTFGNMEWGSWDKAVSEKWDTAMNLGKEAREKIKGNNLEYYLNALKEVRETTIAEFKKKDDKWLLAVDEKWPWGPTNNYCKWFHVCEHESNHNGQMKWIKSRIPGLKSGND